jgi:hypothetical protein
MHLRWVPTSVRVPFSLVVLCRFLVFVGVDVQPDENATARHHQLDVELSLNPPTADSLEPHLTYVPHPLPWNVHNAGMLRLCLESMGFRCSELQKITVKTFLNRILGLPVIKQNMIFEVSKDTSRLTEYSQSRCLLMNTCGLSPSPAVCVLSFLFGLLVSTAVFRDGSESLRPAREGGWFVQ